MTNQNNKNGTKGIALNLLESHLWEAANILRGPVDAADFKTYVFPLLFFKRISDVYEEEYATALAESGGMLTSLHTPRTTDFRSRRKPTGVRSDE
jgi:type I restriction enzyme M protein